MNKIYQNKAEVITEFKAMATWCWVEFLGKELGMTLLQLHWACCKINTEHYFCFWPLLIKVKTGSVSVSVQSLSHVWLFVTPWTAACQASLSITNSQSLLKLMSIELVMDFNLLSLTDCCVWAWGSFYTHFSYHPSLTVSGTWPMFNNFSVLNDVNYSFKSLPSHI